MKNRTITAAEEAPKKGRPDSLIGENLSYIEDHFRDELTDEQRKSLRIMPDSAGGDKLVSHKAAVKFKKEIDQARAIAESEVDEKEESSPLLDSIAQLGKFKAAFLKGKAASSSDIDRKREEAAKAAEAEKLKIDQAEAEKAKAKKEGLESGGDALSMVQEEISSDDDDDDDDDDDEG